MTKRNSLLGRSKPAERLTREEKAALDQADAPPQPKAPPVKAQPPKGPDAKAPDANNTGKQTKVKKAQLKFHWTVDCPECGFKVSGGGDPKPGQRLARCGRCKVHIFLAGK